MYFGYEIERIVDFYTKTIGNVLAFGDINMEESNPCIKLLIQQYSLYNLIQSSTCFKRVPGRCVYLMLTNRKHSVFRSQTFQTRFCDSHHMIYPMLKTKFNKVSPKVATYRDYSKFSETPLLADLSHTMREKFPANYHNFESQTVHVLEKHAPTKKAIIRGNNKRHVSKELRREIMHRSRLKNIANKSGKMEDISRYSQQRNIFVKLNKSAKMNFYRSLDVSNLINDKCFWKTFKPLFPVNQKTFLKKSPWLRMNL